MVRHPSHAQLVAFNQGNLEEAALREVSLHLGDCPSCCDFLDAITQEDQVHAWFRRAAKPAATAGARKWDTATTDGQPPTASACDDDQAASPNQILPGSGRELVLGQYTLLEKLGEGGMGQVFKAHHRYMDRIVALKLMRKERLESPDAVRRFQQEVRALAALSHPNIVLAHDAHEIDDTHLMVMEYVEGAIDLAKLVRKNGPLPVPQACDYIRQAALGLQHAHEKGMVHRDIKPGNLLLAGGVVKILDMGLARLDRAGASDGTGSNMTRVGSIMGTPDFLAPEQALNTHTVDICADLYSLGCTFYFLLTGQVPFAGGSLTEKLLRHQTSKPRPIEQLRPDVPAEIVKVMRKLLAKKPKDRYQTPAELASDLAPMSSGSGATAAALEPARQKPKKRLSLLVGAVGSMLLVGLVAISLSAFRGSFEKKQPEDGMAAQKKDSPKTESGSVQDAARKDGGGVPPNDFTNHLGMKFAWIPPGKFMMGSPREEKARQAWGTDETRHKVTLTRGFYMGKYTVTQEEWQTVMGNNPSRFRGEKNLPVEKVSWEDCQRFIKKLREMDGKPYRLPTEAEWEYACRAGTTSPFYFGAAISTEQANFCNRAGIYNNGATGVDRRKTTPVGSFPANAFGLHDVHGNVFQWCQDWQADYPPEDVVDPQGPNEGHHRVLRGGSWCDDSSTCRSAFRQVCGPADAEPNTGFRVTFFLP